MRRKNSEPTVNFKLRVPVSLAAAVDLLTQGRDGKPAYGRRSKLVAGLLRRYLAEIGWDEDTSPLRSREPLSDEALEKVGEGG